MSSISKILHELEQLADRWEQLGNQAADRYAESKDKNLHSLAQLHHGKRRTYRNAAEDLRATVIDYLEPGSKVRYHYANEWRTGSLLTRPNKDNPCYQIQRNGFGGWVDQVQPGPDNIRVYVEEPQ